MRNDWAGNVFSFYYSTKDKYEKEKTIHESQIGLLSIPVIAEVLTD